MSHCVIGLREDYKTSLKELYKVKGGSEKTELRNEEVCLRKQGMGKHRQREYQRIMLCEQKPVQGSWTHKICELEWRIG